MLLGLVLGFVVGSVFGTFVMGLMAGSARRELEWELARARDAHRTAAHDTHGMSALQGEFRGRSGLAPERAAAHSY